MTTGSITIYVCSEVSYFKEKGGRGKRKKGILLIFCHGFAVEKKGMVFT